MYYKSLLVLHILAGHLALLTGALAMLVRKGQQRHRVIGRSYFFSILSVAVSAIALSLFSNNLFLLLIGSFVLYQCLNGYLAIRHPQLNLRWYSPLLWLLGLVTACWMFWTGQPVLLAFGSIQTVLLLQDVWTTSRLGRKGVAPKSRRLGRHLGQMIGSYIGAFTAFLVVNIQMTSSKWQLLIWLGPTLLFAPVIVYWLRKVQVPMRLAVVLLFFGLSGVATAQEEAPLTRHRFARSYLGTYAEQWPAWQQNSLGLSLGALHFWGHADFQLDIPLVHRRKYGWQGAVRTAFTYYPWAIRPDALRPYLGLAWQPLLYQEQAGPVIFKHQTPLLAGLSYRKERWICGLNLQYGFGPAISYPIGLGETNSVALPSWKVGLSVKYSFDLTLSAEPNWQSGYTARLTDTLAKLNRLDSWTVGIGPSSAFYAPLEALGSEQGHLPNPQLAAVFPEVTAGYYWHGPDLQLQLAYRYFKAGQQAYGDKISWQRHSLALEAYHFFADYHGFVPFLGGGLSGNLHREESAINGVENQAQMETLLPHITIGWDIRPNRLQMFYLRTHLRYTWRTGSLKNNGWPLAQWEVNFIEAVFLLDRW